jgi:hypothetical protein
VHAAHLKKLETFSTSLLTNVKEPIQGTNDNIKMDHKEIGCEGVD